MYLREMFPFCYVTVAECSYILNVLNVLPSMTKSVNGEVLESFVLHKTV